MIAVVKKNIKAPVGASLVIVASFFYATYGIWTKLMGNFFDGYAATAIRSIIIVAILLVIATLSKELETLNIRQNWPYILGMLIGSLFAWGPYYYAVLHAGIAISLAVGYASIVIGMFIFGALFAGERFTKSKSLAATLGIIGLAFIFSPSVRGIGWAALIGAVVGGLSSGLNVVMVKKIHYRATQSVIAVWACSIVANGFMVEVLGKSYPAFKGEIEWLYLFIFSVVSIASSWLLARGVKLIDAGAAGILGLLEIVFGVILGVIFFGEVLSAGVLIGMALIIGASSIPFIAEYKQKIYKNGA